MTSGFVNVPVEHFRPAEIITYTVGATALSNAPVSGVTPAQLVEISADRTVIPAAAGSLKCAGVALHDAAIGAKVSIASGGVWPLKPSGVITAGARLIAGAAGTVVVSGAAPDASAVIGFALEAIASGSVGRVKLTNLG